MQPYGLLAAYIVFHIVTICMPILRLWMVRRYGGIQIPAQTTATVFYIFGCCCVFALNCVDFATLADEIRIRSEKIEFLADLEMMGPKYLKRIIGTGLVYYTSLWSFKAAFVAFFWSLFLSRTPQSRARPAMFAIAGFVAASYVVVVLMYMLGCRPFQNNYSSDLQTLTTCSIMFRLDYNSAGFALDFISDIFIVTIPIVLISRLRLRTKAEAYALAFVFTIGILSPVAATVRYVMIRKIILSPTFDFNVMRNFNFLSSIEYWTALVAFALPSFRVLLVKALRRDRSGNQSGGYRSNSSSGQRKKRTLGDSGGTTTTTSTGAGQLVPLHYITVPDEATPRPLPAAVVIDENGLDRHI